MQEGTHHDPPEATENHCEIQLQFYISSFCLSLSIHCFSSSHIQIVPCFTHATSAFFPPPLPPPLSSHLLLSFLPHFFSARAICSLPSLESVLPYSISQTMQLLFLLKGLTFLSHPPAEHFCSFPALYILPSFNSTPSYSWQLVPIWVCLHHPSATFSRPAALLPPSLSLCPFTWYGQKWRSRRCLPLQQRRVEPAHTLPTYLEAFCDPSQAQCHFVKSGPKPTDLSCCLPQLCNQRRLLHKDPWNPTKNQNLPGNSTAMDNFKGISVAWSLWPNWMSRHRVMWVHRAPNSQTHWRLLFICEKFWFLNRRTWLCPLFTLMSQVAGVYYIATNSTIL